jgi:hypothetical protein
MELRRSQELKQAMLTSSGRLSGSSMSPTVRGRTGPGTRVTVPMFGIASKSRKIAQRAMQEMLDDDVGDGGDRIRPASASASVMRPVQSSISPTTMRTKRPLTAHRFASTIERMKHNEATRDITSDAFVRDVERTSAERMIREEEEKEATRTRMSAITDRDRDSSNEDDDRGGGARARSTSPASSVISVLKEKFEVRNIITNHQSLSRTCTYYKYNMYTCTLLCIFYPLNRRIFT